MSVLLLADLHLTAAPRDQYRWRLFPWLEGLLGPQQVTHLVVLGDLTEAKNHHSAALVNGVVDALARLSREQLGLTVWVLRGNHDAVDPNCPYFRFLRELPFCKYIEVPYLGPFGGRENVLFLPHAGQGEIWDADLLNRAEVVFMHQTVNGARAETGIELQAKLTPDTLGRELRKAKAVWSGDVHVPQRVGPVEYVGAPYPVRFGDAFTPRAVLLTKSLHQAQDLVPPPFRRLMCVVSAVADLQSVETAAGDQVKVRVRMTRAQFVGWEDTRRAVLSWANERGVVLCGLEVERTAEQPLRVRLHSKNSPTVALTPQQELSAWCQRQGTTPEVNTVGQRLLASVL